MALPEFSRKQPQDHLPSLPKAKDMIAFNRKGAHGPQGIKFAHEETGAELVVAVQDKFPEMEDVHIEGRRVVEVSVEMFIQLVRLAGYVVVPPASSVEGGNPDA